MKKAIVSLFMAAGLISSANATITLTISGAGTGALTNLADSSSSAANGLLWGIVVDASGNGFQNVNYSIASLATTTTGVLIGADDVFYMGAANNITATGLGTGGGSGASIQIAGLTLNGGLGVEGAGTTLATVSGDAFAVIWFNRTVVLGSAVTPTSFGLATNAGLKLPGDGANVGYNTLFTAIDPVRPADGTVYAIPAIPEPSAALLGAIGALGLLRRRRN